ncbi:hypothetical protein SBOR_9883 [Sclerotinia borealis F-4128]|uniref:Ribosomal protein YmL11, mitochondrial n=1 Tax=Sclerotinia borealis (strain F-4128) TaxID=1432307 RepID=W9C1Y4_SCLBF|nr:hypothetical protein SBOR_9883 [Sclerotinia borealis F-4128]
MPPRIHTPSKAIASILRCKRTPLQNRQYATAAAAVTPAASHNQMIKGSLPVSRFPSTQPPSYKPPEFRKSQLLRKYASLLRSTPLILLFQHNNLKAMEWVAIRRELTIALRKVDAALEAEGHGPLKLAEGIKLEIVQTGILATALRIVEFYKPNPTDPATPSSATLSIVNAGDDALTHTLSSAAHQAISSKKIKNAHDLSPLLAGPVVLLTFPGVSPQHMKTALTILAPNAPLFPAPRKKANPGWHDPTVQSGLQKLLLLGARVEGKVFDVEGTRWVGSIEGGLDGLRGQLVAMLEGIGGGITNTLESAAKSLYFTVEGRRQMLEDEEKGPAEEKSPAEETPKE